MERNYEKLFKELVNNISPYLGSDDKGNITLSDDDGEALMIVTSDYDELGKAIDDVLLEKHNEN